MTESTGLSIISIITQAMSVIAIVAVYLQVKTNYVKSQREKALELLYHWDKIQTVDSFRYLNLVFDLNTENVQKIFKGHSMTITKEVATNYLPELLPGENGNYVVPVTIVLEIRRTMTALLNTIEMIALAYFHHVSDREFIDNAFKRLFIEQDLLGKCHKYIEQFEKEKKLPGGWPIIKQFETLLKNTYLPAPIARPI